MVLTILSRERETVSMRRHYLLLLVFVLLKMYLGSDFRHSWTRVVNHLPFIYHNSSSLPAFPLPEFLSSNYFCADSSSDVILFLAQKSAGSLNSLPWATFSPPSPSIFWHLLGGQNASRQQTEERKRKRGSNAKYLYFLGGVRFGLRCGVALQ